LPRAIVARIAAAAAPADIAAARRVRGGWSVLRLKLFLRHGLTAGVLTGMLLIAPARAEGTKQEQAELIRSLIPSVVNITARAEVAEAFDPGQASAASADAAYQIQVNAGSGFVIDPAGLIITNWHVVTGAFEITVTFADGTRAPAELAGAARVVDLALLRVKVGHPLPAVRWGDSSKVQVGDSVLAIGNALAVGMSVSAGIVSALNRNISDTPVDDFIQTDAAINHGNSGGPLFNMAGEVIGVNSAIVSPTSASAGLGFAMPSDDVRYVIDHLMKPGAYARPGWLGVKIQAVTPELAEANGFPDTKGSIVSAVMPDGPGQKAGLRPGDVILTLNGEAPSDDRSLLRLITIAKPGAEVTLGIRRFGQQLEVKTTLDSWPQMLWERNAAPPRTGVHLTIPRDLGLTVASMSEAERTKTRAFGHVVDGVLVTHVAPRTDAARRGVMVGDVIMQVGAEPAHSPEALQGAIDRARAAGHRFAALLLLPQEQPTAPTQFPGPKWVTLQIANE
jgi:serine protease Do